jgi:hypothetical protein
MAAEKRFEHYEVQERKDGSLWELGRGAMGVTYKAFDTDLHCTVALKVINPAILNTEGTEQRFLREARAAAQLRHPNIATVLRLGKTEDGTHFYAMEFCEGRTVEQFVTDEGALPADVALDFTLQVARALVVAEEHHVVHRDIKPANLIVVAQRGEGYVIKIIDFGLAKSISATGNSWTSMSLATAGFIGTAHFSSPEQLEEGKVDVRSDIYSLGATLWFMLTGRPMFSGSVAKVMSQHLSTPPPWAELNSLGLDPAVHDLLRAMLAKDPEERPQTALELKRLLQSRQTSGRQENGAIEDSFPPKLGADVLLNRWKLLEEHRGFRRNIFRAVDLKDGGKIVGITFLDRNLGNDSDGWSRLQHAVEELKKFEGVVRPVTLERNPEDRPFLVTQWVNGIDLVTLLRRRGAFSWKEVLILLEQLVPVYDRVASQQLDLGPFCKEEVTLALNDKAMNESRLDEIRSKPLTEWPQICAVINLLPLQTDDLSPNQTLLSMTTTLPGAGAASRTSHPSGLKDLALLVYELLGGTARPNSRRYVPIARVGAAANEFLKSILTGSEESNRSITGAEFVARLNAGSDPSAAPPINVPVTPRSAPEPPLIRAPFIETPMPHPGLPLLKRVPRNYQRVAIAAGIVLAGGLISLAVIKWKAHGKVVASNNPSPTPVEKAGPALEGEPLATEYSPKGDIRVEHRSGGWIYLVAQTADSKHHLLQKSTARTNTVLFSPDENWLVLTQHAQVNDSSSQIYHRAAPSDVEYREAVDENPLDKNLTEAGWKFYLHEVGLADSTARNEVRMSGVEWKLDSSGLKMRFDSFGANGQKILPQPYVCVYEVAGRQFVSESDVSGIRAAVNPTPPPSDVPWKKRVGDFVNAFVQANQSNDATPTVDSYAPMVNYFDQGRIDQAAIRTDVEKYNIRWPTRHDEIENNNIAFQEIQPSSDYLVNFNLLFFASSPARLECVRGNMAVAMHVSLTDGPKITAIQQRSVNREKGVLQVSESGFTPLWGTSKQQSARRARRNPQQGQNQNQPDPAAAEIFNGILKGMSRGRAPYIKPHPP